MNPRIIGTLMLKDLRLYFSNQFFTVITILGLVAYIGFFFLMPVRVEDELELGIYFSPMPAELEELLEEDEVNFILTDSDTALQKFIQEGDIPAGYSFPDGSLERIVAGEQVPVHLYFSPEIPEEFKEIYAVILDEFAFVLSGQEVDIETTEIILGPDMAGEQIPPRQKMLPLLTVFVLGMEILGLASLISEEVEAGTLQALLVTPVRVDGLFVAKGMFGTVFALLQTTLLMGITGGLDQKPLLILTVLLLGSALITGISFFIASFGRDMLSVMGWGMLAIILLAIPTFSIIFPGMANTWVKIIPSYYLADTTYRTINFAAGWSDAIPNLVALFAFTIAFMALGVIVLRRKFR
jgi:ABC-2 type transport system permease protein